MSVIVSTCPAATMKRALWSFSELQARTPGMVSVRCLLQTLACLPNPMPGRQETLTSEARSHGAELHGAAAQFGAGPDNTGMLL